MYKKIINPDVDQYDIFIDPKVKDVHTSHCCTIHGCKYCDDDCTVQPRISNVLLLV